MFLRSRAEASWHRRSLRCGKLKRGDGQFSQESPQSNKRTEPAPGLLRSTSYFPAAAPGRNPVAGSNMTITCSCLGITELKGSAGLTFLGVFV